MECILYQGFLEHLRAQIFAAKKAASDIFLKLKMLFSCTYQIRFCITRKEITRSSFLTKSSWVWQDSYQWLFGCQRTCHVHQSLKPYNRSIILVDVSPDVGGTMRVKANVKISIPLTANVKVTPEKFNQIPTSLIECRIIIIIKRFLATCSPCRAFKEH